MDDRISNSSSVESRLSELGFELPPPPQPIGNYTGAVTVDNVVYISGQGPISGGEPKYLGKLGDQVDVETGRKAAELVILNALAVLRAEIGNLDRVRRIVKLYGMVNSTPDFTEMPQVIDGASDLVTAAFGDRGRHARTAVGFASLPLGITVEIEMVAEIE